MRYLLCLVLPLASLFAILGCANAAVVWDEASMFDLSDDNTEPTPVPFFVAPAGGTSVNTIIGETDGPAMGLAGVPDIFTFEIATGNVLQNITLVEYDGGDPAMFVAIARGNEFPSSIDDFIMGPDTTDWLGGLIVGDGNFTDGTNDEILELLGANATNAGTGFVPPLEAGQYTFYIQQTGPTNAYTLDFIVADVTAVPEPSMTFACGLALVGVIGYRRVRRASQGSAVHTAA